MASPLEEGLISSPEPTARATVWSCTANLFATAVGAAILSLPIALSHTGLLLGLLLLVGFAAASDASLIFLCDAADLTGATSYAELGERCFGRRGRAAVMLCLLAMLVASVVIVLIVVTDVCAMLLTAAGLAVPRLAVAIAIPLLVLPMCLARSLTRLGSVSSVSACVLTLAAASIVTLVFRGWRIRPYGSAEGSWEVARLSPAVVFAFPIQSLAYLCHFSVLELRQELPKARRDDIRAAVHMTIAGACFVYAAVAAVGYLLLGSDAAKYPNVLVAFGSDGLVAFASVGVTLANLVKLPLVLLPLRSLLLEQAWPGRPPPTGAAHVAITCALFAPIAALAAAAADLALVFEVAGCTAGTIVCFCLPGLLYAAALRAHAPERVGGMAAGLTLLGLGATSGGVALLGLLTAAR